MMSLLQDLRFTLRSLARQPAFALLALITLGVGIGAATAIISVTNAVLFRPLPYEDPDRLVFVWNRLAQSGIEKSPVAAPDLVDYQEQAPLFEGFLGMASRQVPLTEPEAEAEAITIALATPNLFSLLGVDLFLGETYGTEALVSREPSRLRPDRDLPPVPMVLSFELWQRRYGADREVIGRMIEIGGRPVLIRGVAPKGFRVLTPAGAAMPSQVDAWVPFGFPLREAGRSTQWITVVGRLKPGVTLAAAQGEMDNIAARQRERFEFHRNVGMEIDLVPMAEDVTAHVRPFLLVMLGAAGLLLLLTFSNVTNLLLLRTATRRKEISIRSAVGGGSGRLVAQAFVETTVLAIAGGALGVVLAGWGVRLLLLLQPRDLPRVEEAGLDPTVLAAALGTALVAALVCGTATAVRTVRTDLAAALSERSGGAAPGQQWLRKALVVVEIGLSVLLLIATGLVYRTTVELSRIDPGYRAENVLTATLTLPGVSYPTPAEVASFFRRLSPRLGAIPGLRAGGAVYPLPLTQDGPLWFGPWSVEGMNPEAWTENEADYRQILPGYFESMDVGLLGGRVLTAADMREDAAPVVVVDEVLARRAWPDREAVGQRLMLGRFGESGSRLVPAWVEVVGVVGHVRYLDLTRDGRGTVYIPVHFWSHNTLNLTLKSGSSDPMSLAGPLREMVRELDPDLPVLAVRPLQDYLDEALAPTRFALTVIAIFAAIAFILATVGLYGVISSAVRQRWREIAIRIAFGAERGRILRLVLVQALALILGGIAVGVGGALLLTRVLSSLLFGVKPTDPATFTAIVLVQIAVAVAASVVPAWRATRVDPVQVLRSE